MPVATYVETFEGEDNHIVKHGLNNTEIVVQAWQNGYLISPLVRIIDENSVQVTGNRIRLTVVIVGDKVPVKKKVSNDSDTSRREGSSKSSKGGSRGSSKGDKQA